jgi:branched-chain amino acid transport system substrate-binding protein
VKRRMILAGLIAAVGTAGIVFAASSALGGSSSSKLLPSSACGPLFYKGSGSPQYIIATDLPLQGAGRAQQLAMQSAVQYVLEKQYKFKAGKYTVGYQACDDSTAQAAKWDPAKCSSNARAYAADKSVIGVMGTFNSGCAKLIIPIINRAPGGPLAMISSANTAVELTHTASWTAPGEPGVYYPTGKRNYVRVSASDDFQGPAAADLMKAKKIKSVYVLHDNEVFGKGVANGFQVRAKQLGIKVLGFQPWDAKQTSYEAIGEQIKNSGAQAVYLGGIVCNNGVKLIQDLRAAIGPKPLLAGPDGFTPYSATLKAGSAAQGMYVSYAGQPLTKLPAKGRAFIAGLKAYAKFKGQLPPYAVYQGQSTQILLDAIARSNGTRASVTSELFKARVVNGIMGTFNFDKNGDTVPIKWISFDRLKGNAGVYAFVVATKVKA